MSNYKSTWLMCLELFGLIIVLVITKPSSGRPTHPDDVKDLMNKGFNYLIQRDYKKAEVWYLAAIRQIDETNGNDEDRAEALEGLGIVYYLQHDLAKAIKYVDKGTAARLNASGPKDRLSVLALRNCVEVALVFGDYKNASRFFNVVKKINAECQPAPPTNKHIMLLIEAKVLLANGKLDQAATLVEDALRLWETENGKNARGDSLYLLMRAKTLMARKQVAAAETAFVIYADDAMDAFGENTIGHCNARVYLGLFYCEQKQHKKAKDVFQSCLKVFKSNEVVQSWPLADTLVGLAKIDWAEGGKAWRDQLAKARAILEAIYGSDHPKVVAVLELYASYLTQSGDSVSAKQVRRELRVLRKSASIHPIAEWPNVEKALAKAKLN